MSVVGTDFKGANHPNWIKNLELAVAIQTKMNAYNSTLTRSINLRGAAFNEQYTSGSLLLEIGSCGNSLEEAKRTAKITAETIADIICGTENKQS